MKSKRQVERNGNYITPEADIWQRKRFLEKQLGDPYDDTLSGCLNTTVGPPDTTFLQAQAWPNPATGPTSIEAFRENTDKRQGGWRPKQQLNDKLLRGLSRYKLGRA